MSTAGNQSAPAFLAVCHPKVGNPALLTTALEHLHSTDMAELQPTAPTSTPAVDEAAQARADARMARIAAAVERSKTEYQPEHAYTERGVSWSSVSN